MSCGTGACGGPCADRPDDIRCTRMCLENLSKNLEGRLRLIDAEKEECGDPPCTTLKMYHFAELRISAHDCDSDISRKLLDGTFKIYDLNHAMRNADEKDRGLHAGNFHWSGQGGAVARGQISGITNANTYRRPFFESRQPCNQTGVMEGRFCGTIQQSPDPALPVGSQVIGTYRFRFDPSLGAEASGMQGTLEGVIVYGCQK